MYSLPRLESKSRIVHSSEGEDRVGHVRTSAYDMCMLADGHGGSTVSTYLADTLLDLFKSLYYSYIYKTNESISHRRFYSSIDRHLQSRIDRLASKYKNSRKLDNNDKLSYESSLVRNLLRIAIEHVSHTQRTQIEGSTLVGFVRTNSFVTIFNIGDSRCYAIDTKDKLIQMTRDHNLKSKRECIRLNRKHLTIERRLDGVLMMTRSIGDADVRRVSCTPDISTHKSEQFKVLALTSDGTYEFVERGKLASILTESIVQSNLRDTRTRLNEACALSNDDRSHIIYVF